MHSRFSHITEHNETRHSVCVTWETNDNICLRPSIYLDYLVVVVVVVVSSYKVDRKSVV